MSVHYLCIQNWVLYMNWKTKIRWCVIYFSCLNMKDLNCQILQNPGAEFPEWKCSRYFLISSGLCVMRDVFPIERKTVIISLIVIVSYKVRSYETWSFAFERISFRNKFLNLIMWKCSTLLIIGLLKLASFSPSASQTASQ